MHSNSIPSKPVILDLIRHGEPEGGTRSKGMWEVSTGSEHFEKWAKIWVRAWG